MSIRVHKVQGHWVDVHDVYTWSIEDGALILHCLNPEPVSPKLTGIELLALFAAGQWACVEVIDTPPEAK